MNKLKNIGISALAGTLVSLSAAQAGGVSVSGSYELSYTNLDKTKVSGNKLGINKNISFGAGGDLSDGGAVTWGTTVAMNDGFSGLSSASMSINMGGIATLTYDSGTGGTGANAVDNIVPTAWEEVDYGFSTGISDLGGVSASKGVVNLTVKAPVAGTGFSLSYASGMSAGHISDGATAGSDGNQGVDLVVDFVDYDAAHAGFRWGVAAEYEIAGMTCERKEKDHENRIASCNNGLKHNPYGGSMFTTLQLGPLHFGTQATFKNLATTNATAIMNTRSIVGGVAAVFGDTLSLSWGVGYDKHRFNDRNRGLPSQLVAQAAIQNECNQELIGGNCREIRGGDEHEYITTKYSGMSAALNLGPVSLKGTRNHADSGEKTGNYLHDTTHTEVNLSIAF
jgi:hypothetical protein